MKHSRKLNWTVIVIGIILIFALFIARNKISRPNTQAVGNTNTVNPVASPFVTGLIPLAIETLPQFVLETLTPLPPDYPTHVAETQTAEPTMSPTATSTLAPPQCTFPLANTKIVDSKPEEYTFSKPKIVLNTPGNLYSLVEWLSDNQQVLVTEDLYNTRETESDKMLRQTVGLYNPITGETKVYATRYYTDGSPAWLAGLNAVVYPAINYLDIGTNINNPSFTRQVRVSYGNPDATQMLADNLMQFPLATKPDGSETVYFLDKQLNKLDKSLKDLPSVPFDPTRWDYARTRRDKHPVSYKMVWQPGTSLIFLYSDGAMQGGGYTFLLDADTGHVCELSLGGWAEVAHWSSDGRYLAIVRAIEYSFPIHSSDLTVLDTATGNLTKLNVTPSDIDGQHYVDDFAWAPDNRHLLTIGNIRSQNRSLPVIAGLYLVDFISGTSVPILPASTFYASSGQNNLAWSPDGSKLLILCPTMQEEHVCFVSVQTAGK